MPNTAEDRERVEAFRTYVEDSVAADDRYGPGARQDEPAASRFATRWTVAPACWFEVAVTARPPQLKISFLTDDRDRIEAIDAEVAEVGVTIDEYLRGSFEEAGIDGDLPLIERFPHDNLFCYSATINLEELRDLDDEAIRDRTIRILEGFMIAFAAGLAVEDLGD